MALAEHTTSPVHETSLDSEHLTIAAQPGSSDSSSSSGGFVVCAVKLKLTNNVRIVNLRL
ncbi:hypothetical protein Belba_1663 [Belliella baltica DSM 15883]|uniref:Uncharacterized protein n=1 Tax=Belliella baltica (strain DSM 15883 / CIP 108006 / LMG 21964 / BA134) TaxID=866536 RepID=I3Z4V1_BELBD|nr:hypothetical protein [Belliella baltica]AFL84269.1 hypothetical protein Belba_1663 [Belliella baltica DSM 15883]